MPDDDRWHIERGGQQVIHKRAVEQLPVLIVNQLLEEGITNPLSDSPLHLSIDQQRIDDAPSIMDGDILEDLDRIGLGINLDDHRVCPAGRSAGRRSEVIGCLKSRFATGGYRAAQRIGLSG